MDPPCAVDKEVFEEGARYRGLPRLTATQIGRGLPQRKHGVLCPENRIISWLFSYLDNPMPNTIKLLIRVMTASLLCVGKVALAAPTCPMPISFAFFESGLMYSDKAKGGIDKAVMNELARRSGCTFNYSFKPRRRIWQELAHGQLMMTGSAIQTTETNAHAWAVNYFGLKAALMIRDVNGSAPKTKEDFLKDASLTLGVAGGFRHGKSMERFIDELRARNRVVEIPPSSMFKMLTRNRFSAVPVYPLDRIYRNEFDVSQFAIAAHWFPEDKAVPRALLFSKAYFSKAQVHEWQTLVQQMRNDGTLKRIFTEYAGEDIAQTLMQFPLNAI